MYCGNCSHPHPQASLLDVGRYSKSFLVNIEDYAVLNLPEDWSLRKIETTVVEKISLYSIPQPL